MKICKDCHEQKPLSEFTKKTSCKDGFEPRCRTCRSIRYNKSTPELVIKRIYGSQLLNSKHRGHAEPAYSLPELTEWVLSNPSFKILWEGYIASNYSRDSRPSVDRLDNSKPYSFDNIRLVTWKENREQACKDKQMGTLNASQRPVSAYNLNGTLHQTYPSTIAAARAVNGRTWGIVTVADGVPVKDGRGKPYNPKTYKGFKWKWA